MPPDPIPPETLTHIVQVAEAYTSLMHFVPLGEENLGGTLLYAGELTGEGRTLMIAANIAGAASLSATNDIPAQKQAIRDGAADFLVNSLDEAVRILKNEIRKREPVSVAVSLAPQAIVKEMLNRGILPNLLPLAQTEPDNADFAHFVAQGGHRLKAAPSRPSNRSLIWKIPAEYAQRPADFDALLIEHLPPNDHTTNRWLRQSPRYLGPQSRRLRSVICDEETARKLVVRIGPPLNP